jgi:DNA gyrase subunit A
MGVKTLTGDDQEVIIISKQGQTIRLTLADIPALGRATQGVRIMRLNNADEVVSLTLADKTVELELEEETEATPESSKE